MDIEWTGYACIKFGDGTTISVNSEAPSSPSAHSEVVDAIIKAVAQIENSDKGADGESGKMRATDVAIKTTDGEDDPIPTLVGADAPAEENYGEGSSTPTAHTNDGDSKPEEPAGNSPVLLNESKPRLLIDIAKSADSSEGAKKVVLLTFSNLYEVFDRDEERATAFVECICVMLGSDVLVIPMNNDQIIIAEDHTRRSTSYDGLVEHVKQAIAHVATVVAIDHVVSVR